MHEKYLSSNIPSSLEDFEDYDDFLKFSQSLFNLSKDEHAGLFNILLKLQGLGQKPIETMLFWKENMSEKECYDMIKFMLHVDTLDIMEIGMMDIKNAA